MRKPILLVSDQVVHFLRSENKCADQLPSYRLADLPLYFEYAKSRFSHEAAHIMSMGLSDALCYHDQYDLFCFIALFATNI